MYSLVLKTCKKLSSEQCSQSRYIGELYLLLKKPPQIMIVNGHRENNSFIVALIQIIIYLQSKAKSKQEIEANVNMTTAQIVRLSFKKSWKVQSPLLWYFVAISLFFSMKGWLFLHNTWLGLSSWCPSCSRACNGHNCGQYFHVFIHFDINAHLNVSVLC